MTWLTASVLMSECVVLNCFLLSSSAYHSWTRGQGVIVLNPSLVASVWVHRALIWHLIPLQHKLSTYRTSEDPRDALFISNLSFRHLYHSINTSSVPVLVPFAISHRYIVIWLQLKLQTSSPPSLDYSWTFNLNLEGVHHCIDPEKLFGTGDQFSLFQHPFTLLTGLSLSPFLYLTFGEESRSC